MCAQSNDPNQNPSFIRQDDRQEAALFFFLVLVDPPANVLCLDGVKEGFFARLLNSYYKLNRGNFNGGPHDGDRGGSCFSPSVYEAVNERAVVRQSRGPDGTHLQGGSEMKHEVVIELKDAKKTYGSVQAVRGISMQVYRGEILGIIGANGAGKTTTLEMMMGLVQPTSGKVTVLGYDVKNQSKELKERIGIQLQKTSLYDRIRVSEAIELFQSYYKKTRDPREIIEMLGLQPYLKKSVKKLSGGWQQRTVLALALINDPEIIFLDEPTTGLDPKARHDLWEIILKLKKEGKTILLSTHYMEEAHKYCDRVAVIRAGELVACDTPQNLIKMLPGGQGTMDDVYVEIAVATKGEVV
jgi:ABC-2 type transport system ATP-binding protein